MIAAIDRHDPDYANPFVAYAVACVVGQIKRHLRDTSWRLQVPRLLMEHSVQLYEAAGQLQQTLGRSLTMTELAQRLGVDEEDVLEALTVAPSCQELSWPAQSATTRHAVSATWSCPLRFFHP